MKDVMLELRNNSRKPEFVSSFSMGNIISCFILVLTNDIV
jgi:hypothetical protein